VIPPYPLTLHAEGVHYRCREKICWIDFEEEMMDPKPRSRRELLKGGALAVGTVAAGASVSKIALAQTPASGAAPALSTYAANEAPMVAPSDDVIAYGSRSHYVTSKRIPAMGRPSPDDMGLEFHLATPLQDSFGTIQASSLHYVATTKGSFIPDIDPAKHTLMIDGLVDRPRVFTMADLKRFPSVSQFHFIECSGNSHNARDKTVQESHGLTSNAEWTGVRLSTLFKECGLQKKATWFVAEGAEEIKGASTIPIAKAMTDVIVAYGMNGEPLRPQQGFPVRLIVPGFEGIFNTKWLRHIKAVDQYQLNMNDFGHLQRSPINAALQYQIGPKSVITFPSGGQKLSEHGWYEITGLAWSGAGAVRKVEVSTDGGKTWHVAQLKGTPQPMAHTRFGLMWNWDGQEHVLLSRTTDETGHFQPTREEAAKALGAAYTPTWRVPGNNNTIMPWKIARDGSVTNGLA
jgi:sulfane dehydrogenase subunit SoxC